MAYLDRRHRELRLVVGNGALRLHIPADSAWVSGRGVEYYAYRRVL